MAKTCSSLGANRDMAQGSFVLAEEGRCMMAAWMVQDRSVSKDRSWRAAASEGRSDRPWQVVGESGSDGDRRGVGR